MGGRFGKVATAAVAAVLLAAGGTWPALAAPRSVVHVPCSAAALTAAVTSATSGETLSLATLCTYGLTAPLPPITGNLTIQGNHATIDRSSAAGTPDLTFLTVGGPPGYLNHTVSVSNLNISNGAPAILVRSGNLRISGGAFSGNDTAIETFYGAVLDVTGASFTNNASTSTYSYSGGGAIVAEYKVNLSNSTFTGNTGRLGGAVWILEGHGTITRCRFADNSAVAGGGLFDGGHVTMRATSFISNHASQGGAVSILDPVSASLDATGSTFIANSAQTGGAIYNYDGLTLTDSVLTANHATQGGAIDQDWYATLTGDLFTRNTATASGGGMYAGYTTTVSQSTFTRNTAGSLGGGIYNGPGSLDFGGPLTVSRSSITGNSAGTDGGGIFNHSALGATAGIADTTVTGNLPDNCAPPGAISGCTAMAIAMAGSGRAGSESRRAPWRSGPWRSVPRHRGGHLPRLLLRELTGR